MCSLLAYVEEGRMVRIRGGLDQPFTAGFACGSVNRDMHLVHSPKWVRDKVQSGVVLLPGQRDRARKPRPA